MKHILVALLFLSQAVIADTHLKSNNCEIFVDRVLAIDAQSYGPPPHGIHFFIKTINSRLDAPIKRVGAMVSSQSWSSWQTVELLKFENSSDYWELQLRTREKYNAFNYAIKIFVETIKGTYYWIGNPGENFLVDSNLHSFLSQHHYMSERPYYVEYGARTQNEPTLQSLNPKRCY